LEPFSLLGRFTITRLVCVNARQSTTLVDARGDILIVVNTNQFLPPTIRACNAPWAHCGLHFTAFFECVVIDWLRDTNQSAFAFNFN
jgi:hypothetical protein